MVADKVLRKPVTALYLRISLDDDNTDISNSVINQKDLLTSYVSDDPVLSDSEVITFADDGFSGTHFERPQVKALLEKVRRGEVQNIIVKDISRWGRNYPDVSEYLDQIFPFLGVRFISVNDQYDSSKYKGQTAPLSVAFSSIIHDMYSKELSVKIKQSHVAKAKKGEYVCGTTPYGFLRVAEKKNHLVIDEEAAAVIRRIFDMVCEGMSNVEIATMLNNEGINSPLEHRRSNGRSTLALKPKSGKSFWQTHTIYRIINDERYTGTLVYQKTRNSIGGMANGRKRGVKLPEEEWIKVSDALPVIVTLEQFNKVKAMRRSFKGQNKTGAKTWNKSNNPWLSKVVCGCCGHNFRYIRTKLAYLICPNANSNIGLECYEGKVFVSELEVVVKESVRFEVSKQMAFSEEQQEHLTKVAQGASERDDIFNELKKLSLSVGLLEQRNLVLYEEFAEGKVRKEVYVQSKADNNSKIEIAQSRIDELESRLNNLEEKLPVNHDVVNTSVLDRLLEEDVNIGEVLSVVENIKIFEGGRMELKFAFTNTLIIG